MTMSMWKDTSNLGIQVVMVFIEVKVYITNHLLDGMDILKMVKLLEPLKVIKKHRTFNFFYNTIHKKCNIPLSMGDQYPSINQ